MKKFLICLMLIVIILFNTGSFYGEGTFKNLLDDEYVKEIALEYLEAVKGGDKSECEKFYSFRMKEAVTEKYIKDVSAVINSLVDFEPDEVYVDRNKVHINVNIKYTVPGAGQFKYIVRFNRYGKIDDEIPNSYVYSGYVKPEYENEQNYIEKEVLFGGWEWKIPGVLTIPKGKGPFPVVVLVHGSGSSNRDEEFLALKPFRDIAVGLVSKNIAVLRYDKRSYEHTIKCTAINEYNIYDETVDDAVEAVKYLSKKPFIDKNNIFVLGHSQGGMAVPRIIQNDVCNRIKGAIIMAGNARPFSELLVEQLEYLTGIGFASQQNVDYFKEQFEILNQEGFSPDNPPEEYTMGTPHFLFDIENYNPVELAKKQKEPLFIIQGERDYQVSSSKDFIMWKEGLSSRKNVSYKLYTKLNHFFTEGEGTMSTPLEYYNPGNIPIYVIKDIADWIISQK